MSTKSLKNFYLFFSSVFIFLLHLPFVFAKTKPLPVVAGNKQKTSASFTFLDDLYTPLNDTLMAASVVSKDLYDSLMLHTFGLGRRVYDYALKGYNKLMDAGKIEKADILTIVDFSQPSANKRLYVIDMLKREVVFNTWVAHGKNSGREMATSFSNAPESYKSSLGFYVTSDTYTGGNGYSLRLNGLERGFNDNANNRAIVMHGADYVNSHYIQSQGWIGRSLGCPAVAPQLIRPIVEKIKNGSCLFIYSENSRYLNASPVLNN
jgi:L,D-transpeptidase catalytic domain